MMDVSLFLWSSHIFAYLWRFGFILSDDPLDFLENLTLVHGLVGGPGLLEVLHPDSVDGLKAAGFYHRMELHIPGTYDALALVERELSRVGFYLQQVATTH